jgi:hypothetical protein
VRRVLAMTCHKILTAPGTSGKGHPPVAANGSIHTLALCRRTRRTSMRREIALSRDGTSRHPARCPVGAGTPRPLLRCASGDGRRPRRGRARAQGRLGACHAPTPAHSHEPCDEALAAGTGHAPCDRSCDETAAARCWPGTRHSRSRRARDAPSGFPRQTVAEVRRGCASGRCSAERKGCGQRLSSDGRISGHTAAGVEMASRASAPRGAGQSPVTPDRDKGPAKPRTNPAPGRTRSRPCRRCPAQAERQALAAIPGFSTTGSRST